MDQACCGCEEILDSCPCDAKCHEQEELQQEHDYELLRAYKSLTDTLKEGRCPAFGSPLAAALHQIDKLETDWEAQKKG